MTPPQARVVLDAGGYRLGVEEPPGWRELAALAGGARALLPAVNDAALERAIETAEDWLMPHAAQLQGRVLAVQDPTGRLREGLHAVLHLQRTAWSVADVEAAFLQLVDQVTGAVPSAAALARPAFVADFLLLRELAHHGSVQGLRLA